VVINPTAEWTIDPGRLQSKSGNTPFAGRTVEGRVEMTVCEGRIVYEAGTRKTEGGVHR